MTDSTHPDVSGLQKDPADKSTPRPWTIFEDRDGIEIITAIDERVVVSTHYSETSHEDVDRANAHLITTAVNSFPALEKVRKALEKVVASLPSMTVTGSAADTSRFNAAWEMAKEALANSDSTVSVTVDRSALPRRDGGE